MIHAPQPSRVNRIQPARLRLVRLTPAMLLASGVRLMAIALALAGFSLHAKAAFPDRPITIVVPYPVGGATDLLARELGRRMSSALKQSAIIENRAGGSQMIGMAGVARAPKDGHTLLFGAVADAAIFAAASKAAAAYNLQEDFAPVASVATSPHILVIPDSVPVRNVKELVTLLKAEPGKHNFASIGVGTMSHLEGELFALVTGVKTVHVPYRGGSQALLELIAGNASMMFLSAPNAIPHLTAGKLRVLAVVAAERMALLPDVPTFAEAGYKGFTASNRFGLYAPKGTPSDVINVLAKSIEASLADKDLRSRLEGQGLNPEYAGPAAFGRQTQGDFEYLGDIVRRSQIRLD